jgi:hypothetical protein
VHSDDVAIQGSLCVGTSCGTNEDFGSDTLRLNEGVLRIHFKDSSTSPDDPTNDWRIRINDDFSGGADYFAIEDADGSSTCFKIEAGAPTSSLYVNQWGRVGLGTSTPEANLHLSSIAEPQIIIEQREFSMHSPQTWVIKGTDEHFALFDGTNFWTPFVVQPNTPDNTLYLHSSGRVGIGTSNPIQNVEVKGTGEDVLFIVTRGDGAQAQIGSRANKTLIGSRSNHTLAFIVNNNWKFRIQPSGLIETSTGASCTTGGVWTDASSREYKENILSLDAGRALTALRSLDPVTYNYKKDKSEKYVGFIAEDVPELVAMKGRKGLSPMDITAVLTKVVQEQQKTIDQQQKNIDLQQKYLEKLEQKIADLEKNR